LNTTVNIDDLVDIGDVLVDENLPRNERVKDFKRQIRDLNLYKCRTLKVRAKYAENGDSIETCFRSMNS